MKDLSRIPFTPELGYVVDVNIANDDGYVVRAHDFALDLHAAVHVPAPCDRAAIDAAVLEAVRACRSWYPTERERLIGSGRLLPLEARPTLRLLPGERERFEAEAKQWLSFDRYRDRLFAVGPVRGAA